MQYVIRRYINFPLQDAAEDEKKLSFVHLEYWTEIVS